MNELTKEIEKSISMLQRSRNPLASSVLAAGLNAPSSPVRTRIVEALASRGDSAAFQGLTESFDRLDMAERKILAPRSKLLARSVPELLQGRSTRAKRGALAAVCYLELIDSLPEMIKVAENRTDPQSVYARDLILDWSRLIGDRKDAGTDQESVRTELLERLYESLDRPNSHSPELFLDSFTACLRWDDRITAKLFRNTSSPLFASFIRHLRLSTKQESLRFLVEGLAQKQIPSQIADVLSQRQDTAFISTLGSFAHSSMTPTVRDNLRNYCSLEVLKSISPSDTSYSIDVRRGVWLLRAATEESTPELLKAAIDFLKQGDPTAKRAAIDLIHVVPQVKLGQEMRTAPSKAAAKPMAADGESGVRFYQELLSLYPDQDVSMKLAIRRLFAPFTLDALQSGLDSWNVEKLASIASIIRIVDPTWSQTLFEDLRSPSPKRRERTLHTLIYMRASTPNLWTELLSTLYDENENVRKRAIEVLMNSGMPEASELLHGLLHDSNSEVRLAAEAAIEAIDSHEGTAI